MIPRILLIVVALGLAATIYAYTEATRTPRVREARIGLRGWPDGTPPIRAVLISDIHVAGPDMPPERLTRIVAQINGMRPDIVLIAGDLVSEKTTSTRLYSMADAVGPLARLRPRLGAFASSAIMITGPMRRVRGALWPGPGSGCSKTTPPSPDRSSSAGWGTISPGATICR